MEQGEERCCPRVLSQEASPCEHRAWRREDPTRHLSSVCKDRERGTFHISSQPWLTMRGLSLVTKFLLENIGPQRRDRDSVAMATLEGRGRDAPASVLLFTGDDTQIVLLRRARVPSTTESSLGRRLWLSLRFPGPPTALRQPTAPRRVHLGVRRNTDSDPAGRRPRGCQANKSPGDSDAAGLGAARRVRMLLAFAGGHSSR